jgi:hypothetical protein
MTQKWKSGRPPYFEQAGRSKKTMNGISNPQPVANPANPVGQNSTRIRLATIDEQTNALENVLPLAVIAPLANILQLAPEQLRSALLPLVNHQNKGSGDAIADLIGEHEARYHPDKSSNSHRRDLDSRWKRFWSRCRCQREEDRCRELFDGLPWENPEFERDFWEGLYRSELTSKWRAGKEEPFWWLRHKGWKNRFYDEDGCEIVGDAERHRKALERKATPAAARRIASSLQPLPSIEASRGPRELFEKTRDELLGALAAGDHSSTRIDQLKERLRTMVNLGWKDARELLAQIETPLNQGRS